MAKTYNIFLSHSWAYSDAYKKFISLLDKRTHFNYKDYSVPKDDPIHDAPNQKILYAAITRQIHSCHVVIILAGVYSTYSKWINKEIEIANKSFEQPKPILAIRPWGQDRISQTVRANADLIVGWNKDSIVNGIRELS